MSMPFHLPSTRGTIVLPNTTLSMQSRGVWIGRQSPWFRMLPMRLAPKVGLDSM